MSKPVAHDQLGAHVLEEDPGGTDVLRGDVEVVHIPPGLDQLAEQRRLADARLAADEDVAGGELGVLEQLVNGTEYEVTADEVAGALVNEPLEVKDLQVR